MKAHSKSLLHIFLFAALVASLIGSALVVTPAFATGTKRYAKATGGATSGSCTTWGTACTLQRALSIAAAGNQVWVKAGVYKPTNTTDRTISFNVKPGVKVYGGFAGTETLLTQRNPKTHVTVLSGDIDKNDAHHSTTNIDLKATDIVGINSYSVATMDGTGPSKVTASTVLDGFTVTGGDNPSVGGGLYCHGESAGKACSPTLSNLVFSGNTASIGGAIYNSGYNSGTSSPTLMDVTFTGNSAVNSGGAMYNDGESSGTSSPTLMDVTFTSNSAVNSGGAMYNDGESSGHSNPQLTNVTFKGNSATNDGGAMYDDGSYTGQSNPVLVNVTFNGNFAGLNGGAMYNDATTSGHSNPSIKNVILWGDTAPSAPEIFNTVGATPIITYSDVQGGYAGTGNKNANPKLNAFGYYNAGFTKTMTLKAGSPAIDHGTNTGCTAKDQNGLARPQDGDHNGSKVCDMGSTEYP